MGSPKNSFAFGAGRATFELNGIERMTFRSREEAGQKLGLELRARQMEADVILGLPRGGVIIASQIARILRRPLDVLVVRKIGHPRFREFAVGALAEAGVVLLDKSVVERSRVDDQELNSVVAEETARLSEYSRKFERGGRPGLKGKSLILADDGLATGATTEAAVQSARTQGASRVVVAVPVASTTGYGRLANACDEIIALIIDPNFQAVGQYYGSFPQTTDEEVLAALKAATF